MHTGVQRPLIQPSHGGAQILPDYKTVPHTDAGVQCEDISNVDCFMPIDKSTPHCKYSGVYNPPVGGL